MSATPSFVSGARIVIKVGDGTFVYAVATSLRVSSTVVKPNVMGEYGPPVIQRLQMGPVQGSFTVMKVLNKATRTARIAASAGADGATPPAPYATGGQAPTGPANTSSVSGRQVNAEKYDPGARTVLEANNNSPLTTAFKDHLDPARVLLSTSVDLEVWHRYPTADGKFQDKLLMQVKNCRLSSRSASISPGQLVNESFNFTGLLLDDGSGKFKLDETGF